MVPYPDLKLQQSVDQVQPPCLIPSLPSQGQMESVHKHILKLQACCAVHPFKFPDSGHMIKHLLKTCYMLRIISILCSFAHHRRYIGCHHFAFNNTYTMEYASSNTMYKEPAPQFKLKFMHRIEKECI